MKLKRFYSGTTFVEVTATILIMGTVSLGMMISLVNFYYHYRQEKVVSDINEYGRMVMNLVVEELNTVVELNPPGHFNGYGMITGVKRNSETGLFENIRITARKNTGLLFNGEIPFNGDLELPDFGQAVDNGVRTITLVDFEVIYDRGLNSNRKKYWESALDIVLTLGLETKVAPGRKKYTKAEPEYIKFTRRVFVPNRYIGKLKTAGGIPDLPT
ncbi:MAG: hypothetical protein HQ562_05960 [Candidatus Marinimicrobia bacterium]|nr:hypothetical protein [Candidatus Neomarinimicrobiota bacterium]